MSKKFSIFSIVIALIIFGFLFFNFGKIEEVEAVIELPSRVFLAAMKTLAADYPFSPYNDTGYFYVPSIYPSPLNPKWVRVMLLFNTTNLEGDQIEGANNYFTIVPNGSVSDVGGTGDRALVEFPSSEGFPDWEYMADVVADRVVDMLDVSMVISHVGQSGTYITPPFSNVTILFRDNLGNNIGGSGGYPINSYGFAEIPTNAVNFTVRQNGTPIGAYIYFYAQRPNLVGFTWSERIGWVSVNSLNCNTDGDGKYEGPSEGNPDDPPAIVPVPPTGCPTSGRAYNYGVDVQGLPTDTTRYISGYAWAGGGQDAALNPLPTIGWIRFDPPAPSWVAFSVGTLAYRARACAAAGALDCSGTNLAAGGWDGWIDMQDKINTPPTQYMVTADSVGNYTILDPDEEFGGWAWGGGGNDTTVDEKMRSAVVGWMSFNSKNCDLNNDGSSDGIGDCPPAGTSISNYKVTYKPVNQAPTVSNLQSSINYCTVVSGRGSIGFSWTYTDLEGANQSQYEIKVQKTDGSPFVDCSGVNAISQSVSSGGTGTSGIRIVDIPSPASCDSFIGDIPYNGTYQWSVRVSDSELWSSWSAWTPINSGNPIASHAYPYPDFSWTPLYPAVFQNVTFNADPPTLTEFYDAVCSLTPNNSNCHYDWTFENFDPANPPNLTNPIKPITQFITAGPKEVTLTATDADSFSCTVSLPVQVGLPLPEWKEIPPTF